MLLIVLRVYADPSAEITHNGVPTNSPELKRNAVLFVSIFPLLGMLLAFLPARDYRRFLVWNMKHDVFPVRFCGRKI